MAAGPGGQDLVLRPTTLWYCQSGNMVTTATCEGALMMGFVFLQQLTAAPRVHHGGQGLQHYLAQVAQPLST